MFDIMFMHSNADVDTLRCVRANNMPTRVITPEVFTQIALLADLPQSLITRLSGLSKIRELERGEVLFSQGQAADTVFAVIDGRMRLVQHSLEGQDVGLSIFSPGDIIGLIAAIGGDEYPGACEAVDTSVVIAIPGSLFHELMGQYGPLSARIVNLLVHRLHEAHDHIRELSAERVERRVARTVLRLANKVGVKTDRGIRLDMSLSRQDLAELSGTTLYTVSRILSEWQRDGLVDTGREEVCIVQPHRLVLIAEDLPEQK